MPLLTTAALAAARHTLGSAGVASAWQPVQRTLAARASAAAAAASGAGEGGDAPSSSKGNGSGGGGRRRAAPGATAGRGGPKPQAAAAAATGGAVTMTGVRPRREAREKVLKATATEEVTRTPEGEVVRWIKDDRKLLRRTKGRRRILEKIVKQDAENTKLLSLPSSAIGLPANVPRVKGIDRPLLPRGVTERGLLPSRYLRKETTLPALATKDNALAAARPQKVNDLLAILRGTREPETRLLAVQQMQFIRTQLTVNEGCMVLDEAMRHFGWRAGLRYVERMGERPEHRLALRHFNRVVKACCQDPRLKNLKSVLQIVEEMEGQGIKPSHQTIYLVLREAAARGDAFVADRMLLYARARGIELDKRARECAEVALAGGKGAEEEKEKEREDEEDDDDDEEEEEDDGEEGAAGEKPRPAR